MSISPKQLDLAGTAASKLEVVEFIKTHRHLIYEKLTEIDKNVRAQNQGDLVFIAQTMPLISGIINVGSTPQSYKAAISFIKETWKDDTPMDDSAAITILSGLIFLYVVEQEDALLQTEMATERLSEDEKRNAEKKKCAWSKVRERVEILFQKNA